MDKIKFITSQGSEYIFDPNTQKSKRTKKSGGSEQGKTFPYLSVVFIKDRSKARLYYPQFKIRVGVLNLETGALFRLDTLEGIYTNENKIKEIKNLSKNEMLVVAELEKNNETKFTSLQRFTLVPEEGLFPLEWGYDSYDEKNREYIKHLGNKIVKVENIVEDIEDESNI